MKSKITGLKMKKLTMVIMSLCWLQSAAFIDAKAPAKDDYIPLSRADAPAGKAYTYNTQNGKDLQIEVYSPEGHNSTKKAVPGMIIFHGGGWTGGNVSEFRSLCHYFASRGLVTATVEYRLITKDQRRESSRFKRVCITDAKSAIRWFKQHAPELGVDPKRIITGGGSAGGHVSLLATTTPGLNDPDDPMQFDTSVVAYILFNPALSGGDAVDAEVSFQEQLKADIPPSIVFFGSEDGWLKGWKRVQTKMKPLGIENSELWMAEGQGHGIFNQPGWSNISIIAADQFLNELGLIEGEPTMIAPDAEISLKSAL
ncbi:alpha/beta hydrolase [Opitutales bacterium]|jgi:acetyl esterase|nr:alpha/beta hydrolase [Opitutales bacterium]MDB2310687.1 alpha/beta hydrolase [Opitutales bacterium]